MITLPWPPSSLSGHHNEHWRGLRTVTKKHRLWAFQATKAARIPVPATGDIPVSVTFHAPDNRSDRMNYWNRCKPYFDGIADAMGVNDKRFIPAGYHIGENVPGGKIVVRVG
jgi:crossover junction endodeoxyribonuclease RusA